MKQGKKKLLWFTVEQLEVLDEIVKITQFNISLSIRKAMTMYLAQLKQEK